VPVAGPLLALAAVTAAAALVAAVSGLAAPVVVAVTAGAAIAAAHAIRRTINSLLAGTVLTVARPFSPGERVRLYIPELPDVADAVIVRIGPANTTLATPGGLLVLPNSRLLRGFPDHVDLDLTG
jgi:small-conductance mechanosensitive channel